MNEVMQDLATESKDGFDFTKFHKDKAEFHKGAAEFFQRGGMEDRARFQLEMANNHESMA